MNKEKNNIINKNWTSKQGLKTLGVCFLAMLYCGAIGLAHQSHTLYTSQKATQDSPTYLAAASTVLFSQIYSSEKSLNNSTSTENTLRDSNELSKRSFLNRIQSKLSDNTFKQYRIIALNFLTRSRKRDLIFPFHYFW